MPINHINGDTGVDHVNRQQMQMLKNVSKGADKTNEKANANGDTVEISQMAQELGKYKKMVKDIPEPNEGRIAELQQAIKDGKMLTNDAIAGSASAIANVLL